MSWWARFEPSLGNFFAALFVAQKKPQRAQEVAPMGPSAENKPSKKCPEGGPFSSCCSQSSFLPLLIIALILLSIQPDTHLLVLLFHIGALVPGRLEAVPEALHLLIGEHCLELRGVFGVAVIA